MRGTFTLAAVLGFCLAVGCGESRPSAPGNDIMQWAADPTNDLIVTKEIGDVRLTVHYLPADALAARDIQAFGETLPARRDSIVSGYRAMAAFRLTVAPSDALGGGDLLMQGATNYGELVGRVETANFDLASQLTLDTGEGEVQPAFVILDNDYGMGSKRVFTIGFELGPDWMKRVRTIDLRYVDPLFETGINHFTFAVEKIADAPTLTYE